MQIQRTTPPEPQRIFFAALLPEALATEDNVHFLQDRLITVWVECECTMKSLLNQYTNGVNGVLVRDYEAAIDALGFFDDDAPSLLRVPNIIGHRGMPSMFVENTVLSVMGAYAAGADAIETDIYLSADGEIFVTHDGGMERLFNRPDIENVEHHEDNATDDEDHQQEPAGHSAESI